MGAGGSVAGVWVEVGAGGSVVGFWVVDGVSVVGAPVVAGGSVVAGEGGGGAEVLVHTNFKAAVPGGASALLQVALPWTRTYRKLRQLESA